MSPELILKCARKADPKKDWEIRQYSSPVTLDSARNDLVVCVKCYPNWFNDLVVCVKGYPNWFPDNCFEIERDWPDLQIALEDEWVFTKNMDVDVCHFRAVRKSDGHEIGAETKAILLAQCVEASQ